MRQRTAFITGVTGQDGAYLSAFLLQKGYRVFGTFRRTSTRNFERLEYLGVLNEIELIPLDLLDQSSLVFALRTTQPDEIYNLAAIPKHLHERIDDFAFAPSHQSRDGLKLSRVGP